jgi:hypothetical protein
VRRPPISQRGAGIFFMEHTRHLPPKITFQKARAMYIAKDDDFIFGKASKNAKHLCSITAEDVHP